MNIHTRLLREHAQSRLDPSRFQDSLMLKAAVVWPVLLSKDQSQLPLMPPTGLHTKQESSTTVQPDLTTESFWSESQINTGKSRTHGDQDGDKADSSISLEETPVVSATSPHIQTNENNDFYNFESFSNFLLFTNLI